MSLVQPNTSTNGKPTTKGSPLLSEKTKLEIQSSVTSPSKTTKVPSPAGTTDPPAAPSTQPLWENWKPAMSDVLE